MTAELTNTTAMLDQMAHELVAEPFDDRVPARVASIRSQAEEVIRLAEQIERAAEQGRAAA